jgi:N-acyl-D-amino-acid deacylase
MGMTLLRDGTIIDGTGRPGYQGHVLVEDGIIKDVVHHNRDVPAADEVIDARGLAVCPGFIDMHSHSDWLLPLDDNPRLLRCLIEQGITTVVAGNCGFSPAPFREETFWKLQQHSPLLERKFDIDWKTMGEFLSRMGEIGPGVNLAELAGHASIRLAASDTIRGPMSDRDLDACLDVLRQSLDEGACGLSFGLGYEPGMYSPLQEIEAFSSVAREKSKPVTVHLKALSALSPTYPIATFRPHNLLALEEMLNVARKTGISLQISHFIFVGRRSFWTADKAIRMVEQARRDGVDVMFDAFPYMCGNTTITVVLPHWFLKMTPDAYRNPLLKLRLRLELEAGFHLLGFSYGDFQIMDACVPGLEGLCGLTITEIAAKWNMGGFDAMLRLCEESGGGTLVLFHTYSGVPGREEVIERVLSHPLCLFETDAVIKSTGFPNPAALGTFPRVLGPLVRDRRLFSLEEAVHRSTHASALRFGIRDRGIIEAGMAADLVVFDPSGISDTPSRGPVPAGRPRGIRHVFMNGRQVLRDGTDPGVPAAGKILSL